MSKPNEPFGTYEAIEVIKNCISSLNPIGGKIRVEMPLIAKRAEDGEMCAYIVGDVVFSFDLKCSAEGESEEVRPNLASSQEAKS